MDGATLQKRVYTGYAKAAARIGLPYTLCRPYSALAPLEQQVTTLQAAFSQNEKFSKPSEYGDPTYLALFDGNQAKPGDYLVGTEDTFFIAGMQHINPILCVSCNRVLNVLRPTQPTGVGAVGYGGDIAATEVPLLQGWPASILQGTKGEKNPAGIPSDERLPWWQILFPSFSGVVLLTSDVITDDIGHRYTISSAELSDLGWRITAAMQGA